MQQDRDRRHAHSSESYVYRPSSEYVSTRSPPYSGRMDSQYQQPARLSEPYFVSPSEFEFDIVNDINTNDGTPHIHREVLRPRIRSALERSHITSHMLADSNNPLQERNPFPALNLESILRLRGVVHIGMQHVTTTYAFNRDLHNQPNIEPPRGKNPLCMLIARIPEGRILALDIAEASACPIFLLQGLSLNHVSNNSFYLTRMLHRPSLSQSNYVPRENDRPPAWIPPSPPRPRSVSWSERPRPPAHEDWNRSQSPPRPQPPPPPAARWSESNTISANPRWGHSRVNSASLETRRIHSRTPTDVRTQTPWDGSAPPRPRSPLQEPVSRNFHRNLVHEVPPPLSSREFHDVHPSARSAAPRSEPRTYAKPVVERFREPPPRPPSARRDDPNPFVIPLSTELPRERPTSSHNSHRSQNYQNSPYARTAPPPPPHAAFSPVTPFSAGPPRQGRDRAPSRAPNALPTPPVAAGLPPRPQSARSWSKENPKPPPRTPSFVEHTRPDRRISDPHERRRSFQPSPTISPSSSGPEPMVHPLGWPKKQVFPTPPVSAPFSSWEKRSPVPRIRPPEIPRPFAGPVTPSEAPQDRPVSRSRYGDLGGPGIRHEEAFVQEPSPEVSNSRNFLHKHYTTEEVVLNTPIRTSPEVLGRPPQQSEVSRLWGKPDPPRLSIGPPTWTPLDQTKDTVSSILVVDTLAGVHYAQDVSLIPPEPPLETPVNHDTLESPLPIEEEIKSETPPVEYRHVYNDGPREWQGATRTLRRAAEERIQDQELPALRRAMVRWIYAENHAVAATHAPLDHGQPFMRKNIGLDGQPVTPPSRETIFHVLSRVFTAEEESQQEKSQRLKEDYQRLARRWTRHCRELDDGNLLVEIEEAEPFPARGNRRNRLEFVRTDYEAEQAVERLQDLARYDAVLLGRINAATVPDMISVASRSSRLPKFHDTNGDILNPEEFYDYEHVDHWTQEEVDAFHAQMESHGKRFGLVACHPALKKKTPQDCVRYYYMEKADDKFRALLEPRNRKTAKRTTRSSTTAQAGPGGIMADIEKVKEKGRATVTDMEVDETDDSAYEAELAPRRGRGRGRGRGGWRGRGRGGQTVQRQQRESTTDLEGDVLQDAILATPTELTAAQLATLTFNTPGDERPPGKKPPFPLLTKSRKRKGREGDDGDLSVGSPSVSAFGSGVTDIPTPVVKRQISSYWHVADRERIKSLLMQHGESWDAIANVLSQKSANQVRNYVRGKPELLSILEERKSQTQPADQPPLWVRWRLPSTNKT